MPRRATSTEPPPLTSPMAEIALIEDLQALRAAMLENEQRHAPQLAAVHPGQRASAANLVHYLAMRQVDLRPLQCRLEELGLSSLGRAEPHVLANVNRVLGLLLRLVKPLSQHEMALPALEAAQGRALLARNTAALLGPSPGRRQVRMMVTLPSEAATDPGLVTGMVEAGMDIARINCAHDSAVQWAAMANSVRDAAHAAGRRVRVLMDLGGPKLRTGPIAPGPAVVRLKPTRDAFGRVVAPIRFALRRMDSTEPLPGASATFGVAPPWLDAAQVGDRIELTDARGADRRLRVLSRHPAGIVVSGRHTLFLTPNTTLRLHRSNGGHRDTLLGQVPPIPGTLHLAPGSRLKLVDTGLGHGGVPGGESTSDGHAGAATIACTLPEALAQVREGQRIWFDDGRIGGVVRHVKAREVEVEITVTRPGGDRLAADKGINLPDTDLALPALTAKDLQDLVPVAAHADMVGLSFAQSPSDVTALRSRLAELGATDLPVLLKIETRRGFERLPELLLAAMAGPVAGVMIARGDLAVECGHERLSEVQEEILWACEAAHQPVVWATQVLETLAKTGRPSRAEITDAAMGGRAECVMLNKGPYILDAMRTLDDILCRMQDHQSKKRSLLRALRSWHPPNH